jgi:hypothetical protein
MTILRHWIPGLFLDLLSSYDYCFHLHPPTQPLTHARSPIMPKFIIERELPGAGKLGTEELQGVSQKSCAVLHEMGPTIQWVQSFVTEDKIYCIYIAPNEEAVREHAQKGGFPANKISEVKSSIDPTTAEG